MRALRIAGAATVAVVAAAAGVASQSADPVQRPPHAVTLRIIVAASQDEAQRLLARVKGGDDFARTAQRSSIDPSAKQGGLLGHVEIALLRPELRDALRGLEVGQLTPVLEIPTGFAFLTVVKPQPGTPAAAAGMPALMSSGAVKYVLDVGGLPEAEAVLRDFPKPRDWNQDPTVICQVRRDSLAFARGTFEEFFSPPLSDVRRTRRPWEILQAHLGFAQLLAYQGELTRALEHYQQAHRIAQSDVPAAIPPAEQTLGVAYLHKAGIDNGANRGAEICLIPAAARPFEHTADAEKAIEHFGRYLQLKPDDLEVRWLLNLAHMMVGGYPSRVPPRFAIPAAAFASTEDAGRFQDVAPQAGLNVFATAGGVIVDDLAGTGRFDVVTSNFYSCGPLHYLANNGDGTFTNRTAAAGLADQVGGLNIVQTDYNNDGCGDILVLRGGWEVPQRKSLLRNNCDGTFTDVTDASGLARPATSTQTAVWSDINNDGWLDLFVGNEDSRSQLFLNKAGVRFEDIARTAGVDRLAYTKGVTAGDYNNDGYDDLYVSNFDGNNFLYRNNRDNTFTEVGLAAGAPGPGRGFATWFFDYDNDGWSDLFATSYFLSVDETARTYLGLPHNAPTLKLYRNLGNGTFRDVTANVGLDKVFMPMGANFGDLDNDGYLDLYLGMGTPSYASIAPHVLLRNKEGRTFVDVTASSGTGELHKGHGIAFADLDHDGDQEIIAEIGGATPGDAHAMRVFENPGHGNDWLGLKLVGVKSNRAGIGSRITVTVENDGGRETRRIHRTVGSGGSFGASPLEQHVGLGKSARIVDVEVFWPASGIRQRFGPVAVNQAIEITEGSSEWRTMERQTVSLGGARRIE
jgi:tetratricopeptide (TPR) repeat protein